MLTSQSLTLQVLKVLTSTFLASDSLPTSAVLDSLEPSLLKCLSLMTEADDSLSLAASDYVNALCLYLQTRGLLHEVIMSLFDLLGTQVLTTQMKVAAFEVMVISLRDEKLPFFSREANVRQVIDHARSHTATTPTP
jgi:hypothetical protein